MIKNEKAISDMELDMVVGGANKVFIKEREDGKYDAFIVSGEGDMDAAKNLLNSGDIHNIDPKLAVSRSQGITREKLDNYIERVEKIYPGLEVDYLK